MSRRKKKYDPSRKWPRNTGKTKVPAGERMQWVEARWKEDPTITINGKNGMQCLLLERFGSTARDDQLVAIRQRLGKERHRKTMEEKAPLTKTVLNQSHIAALKRADAANIVRSAPSMNPLDCPSAIKESADSPPPKPEHPRTHQEAEAFADVAMQLEEVWSESTPPPQPGPELTLVHSNVVSAKVPLMPVVPAPGTTMTRADSRIRYDWCKEFLLLNPDARNSDVNKACKAVFGMGANGSAIGDMRRMLGIGIVKQRVDERHRSVRSPIGRVAVPAAVIPDPPAVEATVIPVPPPAVAPVMEHPGDAPAARQSSDPASVIKAAISMLLEEVPNLRLLTVTINDDGIPDVAFRVQTIVSGKVIL